MGIDVFAPLDPYALARLYGIDVYSLTDLPLPTEAVRHLTGPAADGFSGALIAVGSGRVIVENDAHDATRRRSTLAHEMAHVLLEHQFGLLLTGEDLCGATSATVEQEATELSGELLVPRDAARMAAFRGWTDTTVARYFRVSPRMARWRLNATGARRIVCRYRAKAPRPPTIRAAV